MLELFSCYSELFYAFLATFKSKLENTMCLWCWYLNWLHRNRTNPSSQTILLSYEQITVTHWKNKWEISGDMWQLQYKLKKDYIICDKVSNMKKAFIVCSPLQQLRVKMTCKTETYESI